MEGDPPRNWAKCRRTNYQGRKQQHHFRSSWSVSATETTRIPRLLVWKTSWASWRQHGNCGDVGDHPKFVPATMVSYWCHWCGWNHMDNDAKSCCFDEITILVNKKKANYSKDKFPGETGCVTHVFLIWWAKRFFSQVAQSIQLRPLDQRWIAVNHWFSRWTYHLGQLYGWL